MRVYETPDYKAMSRKTANLLSAYVILNPACTLGLATGSTPVGAYRQLIDWYQKGDVSFRHTHSVNLDEYRGLSPQHPQSYRRFMQENFFDHIDILPENTHVPLGLAKDAEMECTRYNGVLRSLGGVDLQLLGLGYDGHIGFNEPGGAFELETHVAHLAESTVDANARFFASRDEVPREAFTMGIKSIMQARKIVVAVSGAGKADILCRCFSGPVEPFVPASILQMHPDVTLVADSAALAKFKNTKAFLRCL